MLKSNSISKYATSSHAPVNTSLIKLLLSGKRCCPPPSNWNVRCATVTLTPLIKWMRILHLVNQLQKDYQFLPFPLPFEQYQFNVDDLRLSVYKLPITLYLLIFFKPRDLINSCGIRNLSIESQTSCGGIVARNNSLLCTHLSSATGKHLSLIFN